MVVSLEEFKQISMCETAKKALDILEVTHKVPKLLKILNFSCWLLKFEEIRMKEDETFDEFYAKLTEIVNSSFNLGEKIHESRIVRKIMRSLPEQFRPKVTTIEESKDFDTVYIEGLVISLQTYEFSLPQPKKNKSIALKTMSEKADDSSDDGSLNDEDLTLCPKRFKKLFRPRKGNTKSKSSKSAEKSKGDSYGTSQGKKDKD